jgi:hypothetical protein
VREQTDANGAPLDDSVALALSLSHLPHEEAGEGPAALTEPPRRLERGRAAHLGFGHHRFETEAPDM